MKLLFNLLRHPLVMVLLHIVVLLMAFMYGILVGRYEVFPHQQIVALKERISPHPYEVTTYAERKHFPTRSITNRGIVSDTTSHVLARMDTILSTNPKVAFVMVGVNDILVDVPIEEIVANYQEIVNILKNNGIEVIMQSTVQCHANRCGQSRIANVNILNERLEKLAQDEAIEFIHLEGLSDPTGLTDEMTYDGIHLTAVAYKDWLSIISERIKK